MGFRKRCAEKRAQAQLSSHVAGRHECLDQPQVPARKMPKIKQVMKPAKSSALRVACVCVCVCVSHVANFALACGSQAL